MLNGPVYASRTLFYNILSFNSNLVGTFRYCWKIEKRSEDKERIRGLYDLRVLSWNFRPLLVESSVIAIFNVIFLIRYAVIINY